MFIYRDLSKTLKNFMLPEDLAEQSGNTVYPEKSNVPFRSISVETGTLDPFTCRINV